MFGLEVDKDFIVGKIQQRLQEIEDDHPEIHFHKDESYFDEEYDRVRKDSRKFIGIDHIKFCINSHNISQNIFRLDKQVYIHRYYQHMKSVLLACQNKDRLIISESTYDFIMESKPPKKYEMKLWGYDHFKDKDAGKCGNSNRPTPSPPPPTVEYNRDNQGLTSQEALWLLWLIGGIVTAIVILFACK